MERRGAGRGSPVSSNYAARGRGGKTRAIKGQHYKSDQKLQKAASHWGCPPTLVVGFKEWDPFNRGNEVSGYICKKDGPWQGSLFITAVNQTELATPLCIYGTPKINFPYENKGGEEGDDFTFGESKFIEFASCDSYSLSPKWNGTTVIFYKYSDAKGEVYLTAKSKMSAFLRDNFFCDSLSHTLDALGLSQKNGKELSCALPQLRALKDATVQSVTYELCGDKNPSLVKYDFPLALKPLFLTGISGEIVPIIRSEDEDHKPEVHSFNGSAPLVERCRGLQQDALRRNEEYRQAHNLPNCYFYGNFVVEGWVLYLLNSRGAAINRSSLYKIKPPDIERAHHVQFDLTLQTRVLHALETLHAANSPVSPENLMRELDMNAFQWKRFEKDILEFIQGRPNPYELMQSTAARSGARMIILVGVPGSGKSTLAKKLLAADAPNTVRVNQDEMGTRKKCELVAGEALQRGKSVIVDRCNFDYQQRHVWIKMASKFSLTRIECVWLDLDTKTCKSRVTTRKDHPTISEGEMGVGIIDKFLTMFVPPLKAEGFTCVHVVKTQEEADHIVDVLCGASVDKQTS